MAIDSDLVSRMTVAITLGNSKASVGDLTAEQSAFWDRLAVEISQMKANGTVIDVPNEW